MTQKLSTLLFCDAAASAPDGKITLYGLFDVIGCHKLPLRHPQFAIYWKLYSDQLGEVSVRIEKPDGFSLLTAPALNLQKNPSGKYQGIFMLGGVEFPVSGDYRVVFLFNGTGEVGSATLTIQEVGPLQ